MRRVKTLCICCIGFLGVGGGYSMCVVLLGGKLKYDDGKSLVVYVVCCVCVYAGGVE